MTDSDWILMTESDAPYHLSAETNSQSIEAYIGRISFENGSTVSDGCYVYLKRTSSGEKLPTSGGEESLHMRSAPTLRTESPNQSQLRLIPVDAPNAI
jgi:hypothetical protein